MSFYFCRNCRYFSKVELIKQNAAIQAPDEENNPKAEYKCLRCNFYIFAHYCTIGENLERFLFGFPIDQSREAPDITDNRIGVQFNCIQELEDLSKIQKTKIMEELECSICLNLIDMSANLQCLKCKHLFCFYCLIKCLQARSRCPYCNCEVTIDTLGTNSNLISTFNLMVEAKRNIETICKFHKQRCDLYCKDCKYEMCYECILSYKHKTHNLISLKIIVKETKDKLKAFSKPENSVKQLIENQIESINQNKDIFNKIISKSFSAHRKMFDEFVESYTSKIDKIHSPYINLLLLNSKKLEQNQMKIINIAECYKIENLNDVVLAINSISEIERETATIAQKYQKCCIEEEFALIDPPIKKLFEVCTKSLENNESFTLKFKVEDLKINCLYFK